MFLGVLGSMKYIDLHTHTFYSDGLYTPTILVQSLALNGIDVISKTDHDTLRGWEETKQEADKWGIIAIPGVELSTTNYHILGYGFDTDDVDFKNFVDYSMELQRENCIRRVEALSSCGIPISIEKIQRDFPYSRLGKMNLFMTMLKDPDCRRFLKGMFGNLLPKEIMRILLGPDSHILGKYHSVDISPKQAIEAIHSAGGIAILAHPARDIKNIKDLDELVEQGIDGLEISVNFYNLYPPYEEYAKEHGLLITYGSDYHDATMERYLLGRKMNVLSPELEERLLCCAA